MSAPGVRRRHGDRAEHSSRPPPPTPTAQHRTFTAVSPEDDLGELGSEHGSLRPLVVGLDVDDEARIHEGPDLMNVMNVMNVKMRMSAVPQQADDPRRPRPNECNECNDECNACKDAYVRSAATGG